MPKKSPTLFNKSYTLNRIKQVLKDLIYKMLTSTVHHLAVLCSQYAF